MSFSTKEQRYEAQVKLKELGYYSGPLDGIWGKNSVAAYDAYQKDLNIEIPLTPSAEVPWWQARRVKGLITEYSGFIVGALGIASLFIPTLREIDYKAIMDIVVANADTLDSVILGVGGLMVAIGRIVNIIGSFKAEAPIDPTYIANIGGKAIRFPSSIDKAKGHFSSD
jgi:hypothetical protein